MSELQKRVVQALEEARRSSPQGKTDERRVTVRVEGERYYRLTKIAVELGKTTTGCAEWLLEAAIDDAWQHCNLGDLDPEDMEIVLREAKSPAMTKPTVPEDSEGGTLSSRIVARHKEGATTSQIASDLGIRYQHAYNVLRSKGLIQPKEGQP